MSQAGSATGSGGGSSAITIQGDIGSSTGSIFKFSSNFLGTPFVFVSGTNVSLNLYDINNSMILNNHIYSVAPTGSFNSGAGFLSLFSLTSGNTNSAFGYISLENLTTGTENAAFGNNALSQLVTGSYNTALGPSAGSNYTSSESSNINISNSGIVGESNVIRIGTQGTGNGQQNTAYMAGIFGNSPSSPQAVIVNSSGQLGSQAFPASSISITGDSGGALTGNAFTFTGGTTGLTFAGAGTTETLGGTLAIANGGTNATSMSTSTGIVKYDGTRLVTSSTAKIDSSNRTTNTSQPAFFAYLNTSGSNVTGDGTVYTIPFNATLFDQNSNFNTGTGVFTAPVTGKYMINVTILAQSLTTAMTITCTLPTTAHTYIPLNNQGAFTGNNSYAYSLLVPMSASDTMTVTFQASGGSKVVSVFGDASSFRTTISGYLVC